MVGSPIVSCQCSTGNEQWERGKGVAKQIENFVTKDFLEDVSRDGRQCEREFFGRTNLEGSFRRKHKIKEDCRIESRK
jgi:hypothetical protein